MLQPANFRITDIQTDGRYIQQVVNTFGRENPALQVGSKRCWADVTLGWGQEVGYRDDAHLKVKINTSTHVQLVALQSNTDKR